MARVTKGDRIEYIQYSDDEDRWYPATVLMPLSVQFISVDKHGTQRFHMLKDENNTWRLPKHDK